MKRLLVHPALVSLGAGALGAYLRFALWSTRWRVVGAELAEPYLAGAPVVAAFWHERLAVMPALWRYAWRGRQRAGTDPGRMHVLVSRHRDGRLIGQVIGCFGLSTIHGSSAKGAAQKGGSAALRAMVGVLARGDQVVVTPDGPRGPRRSMAPGVAQAAALAGVPVMPCAGMCSHRIVLGTWDRMVLPLPFGRGVLAVGRPIVVPRDGWAQSVAAIEAALTEVAERADAACRG